MRRRSCSCRSLSRCTPRSMRTGIRETSGFNLGQAYATGARNDSILVDRIEHRGFAVIEYESIRPFQLTNGVLAATMRAYEPKRSSDEGTFFLRRAPPITGPDRG